MVVLLEDEVIENLSSWLEGNGWNIIDKNLRHSHGVDLKATKSGQMLVVEAKGSKGNPRSHVTTRPRFNSGQIKDHFGKAIVKVLEEKNKDSESIVAIAHPNDDYLKKVLEASAEEIRKMGVLLFWVESSEKILVDSPYKKWGRTYGLLEFK